MAAIRGQRLAAALPKVVADERTNSVVISGEPKARARIIQMVRQLDRDLQSQGNTRVFYLKYGKAKDLVDVLKGASAPASPPTRRAGRLPVAAPASAAASSPSPPTRPPMPW